MGGATEYYTKRYKSVIERQIPYDFTYVEFMKQNELAKGKKETKMQAKKQTLKDRGQIHGYHRGGGGVVKQVMVGIKESRCCDQHRVLYGNAKSLYCTPLILHCMLPNWNLIKFKLKALKNVSFV